MFITRQYKKYLAVYAIICFTIIKNSVQQKCDRTFKLTTPWKTPTCRIKKEYCNSTEKGFENLSEETGILLEHGACLSRCYRKGVAHKPLGWVETTTKEAVLQRGATCWTESSCSLTHAPVFVGIDHHMVRNIDDQKRTITVDLSLKMYWMDSRVQTYIPPVSDGNLTEIGLPLDASSHIWTPDLYVYNLSDYSAFKGSLNYGSLKILTDNYLDNGFCLEGPMVRYDLEARVTFYCDFDYSSYPMDSTTCELRIGSKRSTVQFTKYDNNDTHFNDDMYHSVNFDVKASVVEIIKSETNGLQTVGLDIKLSRVIHPFMMKYYMPCILIIVVSQCSFIIPLTALPGRVALIVTQFLTLTSIFLQQMVCFYIPNSSLVPIFNTLRKVTTGFIQ